MTRRQRKRKAPAAPKPKRPPGRPPEPVPLDLGGSLLLWLARGRTMVEWCETTEGAPSPSGVHKWLERDREFREAYARAREVGGHVIAERMRTTAATPSNHEDDVQHRKLQIDTDKWLLARWFPTHYGDRQEIAHKGGLGLAVHVVPPNPSPADVEAEREAEARANATGQRFLSVCTGVPEPLSDKEWDAKYGEEWRSRHQGLPATAPVRWDRRR